ncbi:MAG: hypothetical protein KIT48_11170 [Pseudolabrys sp.]|nr:hypothetical protein [Pseudolabrys sp.]
MSGRRFLIAAVILSAASAAQAADLGGSWSGGGEAYCGSDMITVYDSQPGVITRRWRVCKDCDYAKGAHGFRRASALAFPQYPPFMEPWRR